MLHLRFVNAAEHQRRSALRSQLADDAYRAANVTVRDMRPSGRLVSWKSAKASHAAVFDLYEATTEIPWATGFPQVASQLPGLCRALNDQYNFGTDANPSLRLILPDHALALF